MGAEVYTAAMKTVTPEEMSFSDLQRLGKIA